MKLSKIWVENYRQFEKIELNFYNDVTVLAGANNTGKTTLITLLNNILNTEKMEYFETDIPSKIMFEMKKCIYQKLDQRLEKLLVTKELKEELEEFCLLDDIIKTELTQIKFEIEYDKKQSDISCFADYFMDLDESENSFHFLYAFEYNKTNYCNSINSNKNLKNRFDNIIELKKIVDKNDVKVKTGGTTKKNNKEVLKIKKEKFIKQLINIYFQSVDQKCYYCDKEFKLKQPIKRLKDFRSLFNAVYIKASRPLDDELGDATHTLTSQLLEVAEFCEDWKDLKNELPDKLLTIIEREEIKKVINSASKESIQTLLDEIENTNGGHKKELMLDIDVNDKSISKFMNNITRAIYKIDNNDKNSDLNKIELSEESQGLGYSNLLYIHMQLKKYKEKMEKKDKLVNIFFIEEPESHMHPQMQQALIKYILKHYNSGEIQGIISTHSTEIVRKAGLKRLRVLRQTSEISSKLYDLSEVKDKTCNYLFEIGSADIVFADKAILYEGDTEKMFIKTLLNKDCYKKLEQEYISYIHVGSDYAYNYKELIEKLKMKSLIITDLDYEKKATKIEDIKKAKTTNGTIKNFYKDVFKKDYENISDLYNWANNECVEIDESICLTFQTTQDNFTRTLEEAMLCKYFKINIENKLKRTEWIEKQKIKDTNVIKFSVPNNRKNAKNSRFTVRDIINSTSNNKTNFMQSIILNGLENNMEPDYIKVGLKWLMK